MINCVKGLGEVQKYTKVVSFSSKEVIVWYTNSSCIDIGRKLIGRVRNCKVVYGKNV